MKMEIMSRIANKKKERLSFNMGKISSFDSEAQLLSLCLCGTVPKAKLSFHSPLRFMVP
jgi:hypothetical protein